MTTLAVDPIEWGVYCTADGLNWQVGEARAECGDRIVVILGLDEHLHFNGPVAEVTMDEWRSMAVSRGMSPRPRRLEDVVRRSARIE